MDDNESYEYEKGAYSEIVFTYSEINKTLNIKKGVDNYKKFEATAMPLVVELVGNENTQDILFNGVDIEVKF